MNTSESLEAAEARMNTTKDALLNYVERRDAIDVGEYRRLVARVKRAEADFLKALSELDS